MTTIQQIVPGGRPWKNREASSVGDIARAAELVEIQLQRSRDVDLFITIQSLSANAHAQPFLRIILPHLHRAAYIRAPYHVLANTPLSKPLDRLTHLIVDHCTLFSFEQDEPGGAPLLHVVGTTDPADIAHENKTMQNLYSQPRLACIDALWYGGPQTHRVPVARLFSQTVHHEACDQ